MPMTLFTLAPYGARACKQNAGMTIPELTAELLPFFAAYSI